MLSYCVALESFPRQPRTATDAVGVAARVCAREQTPRPSRRQRRSVRLAQPARGRSDATHAAICSAHAPRHSFANVVAWLHPGASVAPITAAAIHPRLILTPRISAPGSLTPREPSLCPPRSPPERPVREHEPLRPGTWAANGQAARRQQPLG